MSSAFTCPSSRWRGVSSLKVAWRRDPVLDAAIVRDKKWRLCSRIVREVLNEPRGAFIPVHYLERRRERLGLPVRVKTFLARNPTLFDLYRDRAKPTSSSEVPFLKPSARLTKFLNDEQSIRGKNEGLALEKLCKLLMMSSDRAISAEKLNNVKRDFGFPDDFLTTLVPKHPELVRLIGVEPRLFVELASWNDELARSVIERRAEEEAELTGIRMRPNFEVRLPRGFFLRKEMREWVRDWLELPYISPYSDASGIDQASREMEKRMVGVLHEVLSLAVLRRAPVPTVGKFKDEYRLSNEFGSAFTRHPGIFYVSLKGGIKTAMLREAYRDGVLVDRDPLLEIKERFEEMLEEGHQQWLEQQRLRREAKQREKEMATAEAGMQGVELGEEECSGLDEQDSSELDERDCSELDDQDCSELGEQEFYESG